MDEADKRERRSHFRGAARPGKAVELRYGRGDEAPIATSTRNIGVGGAFIATSSPLPVGTALRVSIAVPTAAEPLELEAEVRWVGRASEQPGAPSPERGDGRVPHDSDEDGDPPGMGVEFRELTADQLVELSDYFASLTGADTEGL